MFETEFAYGSMYYLLVAAASAALGHTIAAVRLANAVSGALAIPATYLVGRQLLGRRVGIVAAVLLATLHVHIHLSRTALGQAVDTFIAAAVIFAFARGLDRRSARWMAIAGVGLGLAQYGYVGGRLIDLVVLAFVLLLPVIDLNRARRSVGLIAAAFGASLVTAAPMIRFALDHSDAYLLRLDQLGIFQAGILQQEMAETGQAALRAAAGHLALAIQSFVAMPVVAFYFSDRPMLDFAWTALVVLGLGYAVLSLRNWRFLILVLHVVGGVLLIAFSSKVSVPVYRALGVAPSLAILAGFSLVLLIERSLSGAGTRRRTSALALAAVVAAIAAYNLFYYFGQYSRSCAYAEFQVGGTSIASEFIAAQDPETKVLTLAAPAISIGAYPSSQYLTQRQTRPLSPQAPDAPPIGEPGSEEYIYEVGLPHELPFELAAQVSDIRPLLAIAYEDRIGELEELADTLPGGTRGTLKRCGEPLFETYLLADTE
jgi:4-amino-4-deoxy-L-arabinose transferase-like glycosyltransferase